MAPESFVAAMVALGRVIVRTNAKLSFESVRRCAIRRETVGLEGNP